MQHDSFSLFIAFGMHIIIYKVGLYSNDAEIMDDNISSLLVIMGLTH